MKVWDPFVRVAHWCLAACVLAAWVTGELKLKSVERPHEWLGYAVLVVVARFCGWIARGMRASHSSGRAALPDAKAAPG
jgi:cytochrome b